MKTLAKQLLEIGAVSLSPNEPYTWASGLRSPIYCDNRLTLSYPEVRGMIADRLAERIRLLEADIVAGTATAGIPHAAFVAERLGLPMVYVRGSAKKHGKGNQIEGRIKPGDKVVVIEDLLSTGNSALDAVSALRGAGAVVVSIEAIFSYGMTRLFENLKEAEVGANALLTFDELIAEALAEGDLTDEQHHSLAEWADDPAAWSERFLTKK
ncbi:orotate phosphoribosyltransferase [Exiguobacterium flavidum]|uniref:orotate phosphoribosyltransferase n=1 Tax=Exiguobacterium flavidum TaxID=2184695 RepID=UPI000DF7C9B8|nr:orotate phosphoribosyltransferase [Exiguobacterium flavidum]